MQFNIDEMFGNINSSPSVIDVSSESGEEFTVEPGNVHALDERFRVGGPDSDAMSAFVGAAAATLFPSSSVPFQTEEVVDTIGSQIERQLMEMIDEHPCQVPLHHSLTLSLRSPLNRLTIRKWKTDIR